jgi:hypothetical protein
LNRIATWIPNASASGRVLRRMNASGKSASAAKSSHGSSCSQPTTMA